MLGGSKDGGHQNNCEPRLRVSNTYSYIYVYDFGSKWSTQVAHGQQQHGAAEARRAHNPEDVGSKPTVASTFCLFILLSFSTVAKDVEFSAF